MAENREERTATEMASQRINATNPGVLELQNAAAGGVNDIHAAAAQAQQQIDEGEDPEQAVSATLGAGAAAGPGAEGAPGEQLADQAAGTEEAEGMISQAGEAAARTGQRLVEAARGFAMEVSESLFGGKEEDDERNKI